MRFTRYSFILLIGVALFSLPKSSTAQRENWTWHFGHGAALEFSGGSIPSSLPNSSMRAFEGTASISDRYTGQVLFYTNGLTIWDSTHNVMQNGYGLSADTTSAQATVIIPIPCDTNLYYVLSNDCVDCRGSSPVEVNRGMVYSIVDMRLNGGRGAVVQKNIPFLNKSTERLAVTMHENGKDYWIVTQELASYSIYAYPLTCKGLGTPVISPALDHLPAGSQYKDRFGDIGAIQISPDGTQLALSSQSPIVGFIDIYRFDSRSGAASDPLSLPIEAYQTEFSPDGSKLYWIGFRDSRLHQIDLSLGSTSAILSSDIRLGEFWAFSMSLQLGPDGKIYFSARDDSFLSVVHNPNLKGAAAQVEMRAVSLGGKAAMFGLPNMIDSKLFGQDRPCVIVDAQFRLSDDTVCVGEPVWATDLSAGSTGGVRWMTSDSAIDTAVTHDGIRLVFATPGQYRIAQIASVKRCNEPVRDTAYSTITVLESPRVAIEPDLWICEGKDSGIVLEPAVSGTTPFVKYSWSPQVGLSCYDCPSPTASPNSTTSYTLRIDNGNGCEVLDTVTVWVGENFAELKLPSFVAVPGDTLSLPLISKSDVRDPDVARLTLRIRSDSSFVLFRPDVVNSENLLGGTALEEWRIISQVITPGSIYLELEIKDAAGLRLKSGDTLLRIPGFLLFGGSGPSYLHVQVGTEDLSCLVIDPVSTAVEFDFCGVDYRGMQISRYSLTAPTLITGSDGDRYIRVSLPWESMGRVAVYDLTGARRWTLFEGLLSAGESDFTAERISPGVYVVCLEYDETFLCSQILVD